MPKLHGITVTLYEKQETGRDELNAPIYDEVPVSVDNVLIGQPATQEILDTHNLVGKTLRYTLGIPRGDSHNWENAKVEFFGEVFVTIGKPMRGIGDLIPLDWDQNIGVATYE